MTTSRSSAPDALIAEALAQDFSGWDFSWLKGRWEEENTPWDYREIVEARLSQTRALLDMGTGGGEFLSSLRGLPRATVETEAWSPNFPVARKRLEPLGIRCVAIEDDRELPFENTTFDLVINRHEAFWSTEVFRILKPGGRFITQQVGGENQLELNTWFLGEAKPKWPYWKLDLAVDRLTGVGFTIADAQEAYPQSRFFDIGAIVYYMKVIVWQIDGWNPVRYRPHLLKMHDHIQKHGHFLTHDHRFMIEAAKPDAPPEKSDSIS